MSKIQTVLNIVKNKKGFVYALGRSGALNWMSDERYLRLLFKERTGEELHIDNPVTFNEKLQWLKIYERQEKYSPLVDKIEAKRQVAIKIGEEHVVPILGVWGSAYEIEFSRLPEQFVLKCNHDQGSVIIIKDKNTINTTEILDFLNMKLKQTPYTGTREHAYRNIVHKVFAERYLGDNIIDYKFYCFNGEPLFLYCGQGLTRDHSLKIDFYDMEWKLMPFYRTDYDRLGEIPEPSHFNEMKEIARTLSHEVPFVRIDLFEVNEKVYFSEFTLCPTAGFMPFVPKEYDKIVGSWLVLPSRD